MIKGRYRQTSEMAALSLATELASPSFTASCPNSIPVERATGVFDVNVLYHSLSALASAEVHFWFTCRRKRLVARADGCGERCRCRITSANRDAMFAKTSPRYLL